MTALYIVAGIICACRGVTNLALLCEWDGDGEDFLNAVMNFLVAYLLLAVAVSV